MMAVGIVAMGGVAMGVAMIVGVVVVVGMIMTVVVVVVMVADRGHSRGYGHVGGRLRIEDLAEEQHRRRSGQWKQGDEPNEFEKIHSFTTSADRSRPPGRFLYCGTGR